MCTIQRLETHRLDSDLNISGSTLFQGLYSNKERMLHYVWFRLATKFRLLEIQAGWTHANRLDANPPSKYSPHFDSAQIPKFAETLVYINIVYLTKFVRRSWLYQLASPVTFRLAIENNNNHCVCMYLLIVGQSSYFSDFCPPRRYCFYGVLGRERGGGQSWQCRQAGRQPVSRRLILPRLTAQEEAHPHTTQVLLRLKPSLVRNKKR